MATYETRFTAAEFLGDIDIALEDGAVTISGTRAPHGLVRARLVGQWILVFLGIAGILAGVDSGIWLLFAAPVYSFAMYLILWRNATEQQVHIRAGAHTAAATGFAFRWYDAFWLLNFFTTIGMLINLSSTGKRTVSFRGPHPAGIDRDVRYLVLAEDPGQAATLTAGLLGMVFRDSASG